MGGHTWPDAIIDIPGSNTNHDFNASAAIWEFFKGDPFVGIKDRMTENTLSISVQNELLFASIGNNGKIESMRIVNALGQEVLTSATAQVSIVNLRKGLYFVIIETPQGFVSKSFMK